MGKYLIWQHSNFQPYRSQKFSRIQRWEWSEQVRGLENERLGLDFLKAELSGQGLGLRVRCGMKGGGKVNFSGDLLRVYFQDRSAIISSPPSSSERSGEGEGGDEMR